MTRSYNSITVASAGAEICNVDIASGLSDEQFLDMRRALNEFTCRFHERNSAIMIGNNRATYFCALNDYHNERRLIHRVMPLGGCLGFAS